MELALYMTVSTTEVLGPYKRFALWVQGCNKRCKGCIAPDAQSLEGGYAVDTEDLATEVLSHPEIEGITISGGEPFLQQEALCDLIELVRKERDIGVIVYTGMQYSEIETSPLAQLCDLIIDGEYIEEENDDKGLRGSSNQNAICLTRRYKGYVQQHFGRTNRRVELIQQGDTFNMIGIPSRSIVSVLP